MSIRPEKQWELPPSMREFVFPTDLRLTFADCPFQLFPSGSLRNPSRDEFLLERGSTPG
jgi:hypothetical protein